MYLYDAFHLDLFRYGFALCSAGFDGVGVWFNLDFGHLGGCVMDVYLSHDFHAAIWS